MDQAWAATATLHWRTLRLTRGAVLLPFITSRDCLPLKPHQILASPSTQITAAIMPAARTTQTQEQPPWVHRRRRKRQPASGAATGALQQPLRSVMARGFLATRPATRLQRRDTTAVRRATTPADLAALRLATCRNLRAVTGMTSTRATAAACVRASSTVTQYVRAGQAQQGSEPRASTTCSGLRSATTCLNPLARWCRARTRAARRGLPLFLVAPSVSGGQSGFAGGQESNTFERIARGQLIAQPLRITTAVHSGDT